MSTKVKYIDSYPKGVASYGGTISGNIEDIKSHTTAYLTPTNWGFKVPAGARIDGITVEKDYGRTITLPRAVNGRYTSYMGGSTGANVWYDEFSGITKAMLGASTFQKHDDGKTEYHHIPADVMEDVAEILTAGEKKYPGENWKKCTDKNRYLNAMDRHLTAWRLGERVDTESCHSHLAHAICNLLFLAKLEKNGKI